MSEPKSARTSLSLFLSTALHGAVIALIALGPAFIPGLGGKGDRDSKNIEIVVQSAALDNTEPVALATEPTALPPPLPAPTVQLPPPVITPQPVKPIKVAKQKSVKKIKPVQINELPEKSPEKLVDDTIAAAPSVVVEESPAVIVADKAAEEIIEEKVAQSEEPIATEEPKIENIEPVAAAPEIPVTEPDVEQVSQQTQAQTPAVAQAPAQVKTQAGTTKDEFIGQAGSATGAGAQVTQNYTGLRQLSGNKPPVYSRDFRIKKLQGRGQLIYYVKNDGSIGDLQLSQSTGSAELDQAAISAFQKYKFIPGQEGYTKHDFEFSLSGPAQNDTGRLRTTLNR